MVQIYVEISKNVSFFISCIKFRKIFIESFNEISLIRRSENNSNNYQLGFWQMDFKENIFNVRGDLRRLPVTLTIPQQTRSPLNLQVLKCFIFLKQLVAVYRNLKDVFASLSNIYDHSLQGGSSALPF